MLSLSLLVLAAPSAQATQFAQQMCEYYAQVLDVAKLGDDAAKTNDFVTAHSRWAGAQQQLEAGVDQLARAKQAGMFPDDVKAKCAAGSFTGVTLAKAFTEKARAMAAKAGKAETQAKSGALSDAQKALTLSSLGKTLDAAEQLEKDALAAQKKDPAKAQRDLEKTAKAFQWMVDTAAQLEKGAKLTKKDTVPTKGGALALSAVVKRASAGKDRAEKAASKARADAEKLAQAEAAKRAQAARPRTNAVATRTPPAGTPRQGAAVADRDDAPDEAPPEPEPEAPAAAPTKVDYVTAATFAAGRCNFGNCAKQGWSSNGSDTSCNFNECLKHGWQTRHPDGRISETSCNFNDCLQHGWSTRHPDGRTSETSCNFNECATHGWDTRTPAGTASTSCDFNECFKQGWQTQVPGVGTVSCHCDFNDCLENGASCD